MIGKTLGHYQITTQLGNGSRIVFASHRKGNAGLFEKKTRGVGEETVLLDSPDPEWPEAWSKDGRYVAYIKQTELKWPIFILPLFGERKPFPIVQTPGINSFAAFSIDGNWFAYASNEQGRYEVYVISFPNGEGKLQISSNGGVEPRWRRDGKEVYYLALDGKLMAVDISGTTGIISGVPHVLFDAPVNARLIGGNNYAVTPDGQRFLFLKPLAEAASATITILFNWTLLLNK